MSHHRLLNIALSGAYALAAIVLVLDTILWSKQ